MDLTNEEPNWRQWLPTENVKLADCLRELKTDPALRIQMIWEPAFAVSNPDILIQLTVNGKVEVVAVELKNTVLPEEIVHTNRFTGSQVHKLILICRPCRSQSISSSVVSISIQKIHIVFEFFPVIV